MDRVDGSLRPVLIIKLGSKKPDLELEAGARAHFDDPLYYAKTYEPRLEDATYYARYVAMQGIESVLEQGIGNGRIALPLARAGVAVTGIDHSQPMLDHLRERLKSEPAAVRRRIKLHHGDIRTKRISSSLSSSSRFPLVICPFNAALHLYERVDVEEWLARTREHLSPDGELVFDISMPILEDLARDPNVPYRIPPFDHPTVGRVSYREHFDYDRVRQILFVSMFFDPQSPSPISKAKSKAKATTKSQTEGFMTPLAHRQFYPREMEALLHYNGFEVTALYGDFHGGPLGQRSDVMVWHARPRKMQTNKKTKKTKKKR